MRLFETKKQPSPELCALYDEIARITEDRCRKCVVPYQCCNPEYCAIAVKWARDDYDIDLEPRRPPQEGQRAPFLAPDGACVLEPWLRPMCAVHVCEGHLWRDLDFHAKYMDLRDQIGERQLEEFPLVLSSEP